MNWKILAIILLVIVILENAFLAWGYSLVLEEDRLYAEQEQKMNVCYYETCSDYPEAWFENNVCSCYQVNTEGTDYEVAKETYMG